MEVREPSAQSWREEYLRERMNIKIVGRVCVWVRTDSASTPLPKPLLPQPPAAFLNESGWNKKKEEDIWVFLSLAKVDNFPHPYPCENHAPFDLVSAIVAGWVHF